MEQHSDPVAFLKYHAIGYAAVMPEDKNGKAPLVRIDDWTEALDAQAPVMILEFEDPDDNQRACICLHIDNTRELTRDLINELVRTGDPYAKVLQRIMNLPDEQITQMAEDLD